MGKKKGDLRLSAREAAEGADLAAKNAKALLAAAECLGKKKLWGPGISLCVLAAEEGAKTLALRSWAWGFRDGVSLWDVFREHRVKHELAQGASVIAHANSLLRAARDSVQADVDAGRLLEKQAGSAWVERAVKELQRLTTEQSEPEMRFATWYKGANALKNNGFYVDWRNSKWHDPGTATKKEYEEHHAYVVWWLGLVDAALSIPAENIKAYVDAMNAKLAASGSEHRVLQTLD